MGRVAADWIVVATDAYAEGAPWPQGKREQIRVPYFNFATRPLAPELAASILPGREGCWDTRLIMNSFRFDQAGRLLFGSIGALRLAGLEVHRAWAKRALKKTFPQIGEVEFEAQWYGMMGMTSNALPRFHRLRRDVVTFCGYNGRGIGTGTVFGRLLADHVLGKLSEKDLPLPVTEPDAPAAAGFQGGLLRGRSTNRPRRRRMAVSALRPVVGRKNARRQPPRKSSLTRAAVVLILTSCLAIRAGIDVRLTTRHRVLRRDEEAFRTDSGLATSGRSLQLDLRDCIYGYGNRQMVQRNERLWFHPA